MTDSYDGWETMDQHAFLSTSTLGNQFGITGHYDDLAQDCGNSSALTLESPQSWTKPMIFHTWMSQSIY